MIKLMIRLEVSGFIWTLRPGTLEGPASRHPPSAGPNNSSPRGFLPRQNETWRPNPGTSNSIMWLTSEIKVNEHDRPYIILRQRIRSLRFSRTGPAHNYRLFYRQQDQVAAGQNSSTQPGMRKDMIECTYKPCKLLTIEDKKWWEVERSLCQCFRRHRQSHNHALKT